MPTFREDTKIGGMVPMMKTDDINDQAITKDKIRDGNVTTEKLADGAVSTDKLPDGAIKTPKIADGNITTSKLAEASVVTSKIADQNVTKEKIADQSVDNSKLSPEAVTYDKLKDKAIITEKLNDRAVTTEKIEEKAITNPKLGNQSVDGRVVREASIENKHIANNAVSTSKIASRSVTTEKIAQNSVSRAELAPDVRSSIDKKADAEQVNNSLYDLEKKIGDRFVVEGDVTNLPDEEDLTSVKESERDVLKLADRSYAPEKFSGKGYKILRRNIKSVSIAVTKIQIESVPSTDGTLSFTINGKETQIAVSATTESTTDLVAQKVASALQESMTEYEVSIDTSLITLTRKFDDSVTPSVFSASTTGVVCTVTDSNKREFRNILTEVMINQPNTIYEIRYDYDLNGETIEMQEGCTLKFNGGKIRNGVLNFDDTEIVAISNSFENCRFSGTLKNDIVYSKIFGQYENVDSTVFINDLISISKHLYLSAGTYLIDGVDATKTSAWSTNSGIKMKSNFILELDKQCFLQLIYKGDNYEVSNIITCFKVDNFKIIGGNIIGDKNKHSFQSDFAYGIFIAGCKNGEITNVNIDNCNGDSINLQLDIKDNTPIINENIRIVNCVLSNAGRNCMSIECGKRILIENCELYGANSGKYSSGMATPSCGCLIEPYTIEFGTLAEYITFSNCYEHDNNHGINSVIYTNKSITIINSNINSCIFDSNLAPAYDEKYYQENISILNSTIKGILFFKSKNIRIINSVIKNLKPTRKCEYISCINNSIETFGTYSENIPENELFSKNVILDGNIIKNISIYFENSNISNNIFKSNCSLNYKYSLKVTDNQFITEKGLESLRITGKENSTILIKNNVFLNPSLNNNYGDVISAYGGDTVIFDKNYIKYTSNDGGKASYYFNAYNVVNNVIFIEPFVSIGLNRNTSNVTHVQKYKYNIES